MRPVSQEKDFSSRQPAKGPGTSSLSGSCCRILDQLGEERKDLQWVRAGAEGVTAPNRIY